jgi:hypothetical protein
MGLTDPLKKCSVKVKRYIFCCTVMKVTRQELAFCAEVQKVSLRLRAQPLSSTRPQELDHNLSCLVPVVPAAAGAMPQHHGRLRDGCD